MIRSARGLVCFAFALGLAFAAIPTSTAAPHEPSFRSSQDQRSPADGFLAKAYHSPGGETMQYRLFVPPGYDPAKKYPIVLWLHGAAGRGSDNILQLSGGNYPGTHVWTTPEMQTKYHAFVLAPQVEITKTWSRPHVNTPPISLRLALEILDTVEKEYSIDRGREYVAGQSMGGEGVWAALATARGTVCGGDRAVRNRFRRSNRTRCQSARVDFSGRRRSHRICGANSAVGGSVAESRWLAQIHRGSGRRPQRLGQSVRRPGFGALAFLAQPAEMISKPT